MTDASSWGRAFARQAKADFDTYEQLENGRHSLNVPKCHNLHFLQMACEKLAKAHLCSGGADPYSLQTSHAYIGTVLPIIARQHWSHAGDPKARSIARRAKAIKHVAREIEILSPAVDDQGRRRDNCEYPWEVVTGTLRIPAEHDFPNLSLLTAPLGRTLLKIVRNAIAELTKP